MKIITTEQGTEAWLEARRGHITASMIDCVIAGRHTNRRMEYLEELAMDLAGVPDFSDHEPAPWFEAGHQYEGWARGWYSWETGADVAQTGFCESDQYEWLGMSPDGLVGQWLDVTTIENKLPRMVRGEGGGLTEIKFRKSLTTYRRHTSKPVARAVMNQMQTQMWVAGADWCDYVNFWRDDQVDREEGSIRRIYRDQARIDYLEERCLVFWGEVLTRSAELNERPNTVLC